ALGSLSARFGQEAPGLVAAALCVVNIAFAWRWLPESKPRDDGAPRIRRAVWFTAWSALRHPGTGLARLLWIYGIGMLAFSAMTSVLSLYLGAEFGLDATTIGPIFTYIGVLSFVMRSLLLGPIVDRLGEAWTMRVGTVLLVLGLVLYPLPRTLWGLAAVIPLVPIGTALLFPSTTSLMSRHSDPREYGATMGVAQTFAGIARVAAPLLATVAFQRLGHGWPFYLAGACVGVVGILAFQVPVAGTPSDTVVGGERGKVLR
nr:MFS transporter [Gemmatimonadales bacterium]